MHAYIYKDPQNKYDYQLLCHDAKEGGGGPRINVLMIKINSLEVCPMANNYLLFDIMVWKLME